SPSGIIWYLRYQMPMLGTHIAYSLWRQKGENSTFSTLSQIGFVRTGQCFENRHKPYAQKLAAKKMALSTTI
ncbi:hypothetical protein, partial [Aquiflexum lacus]|uniref:hypothetical protein n=1 Tax=Aquiflexum lacus TaxID=2483805 RepID=UPI001E443EA9